MAKEVVFKIGTYTCKGGITKVDRDKVYGWTEEKYTDASGAACRWATLLDDGKTIVASGGTSLKAVDTSGKEIVKSTLVAIDANGNPAVLIPSVFEGEIALDNTKTTADYLSMDVKSVYQLAFTEGFDELLAELNKSQVLYFVFNYRSDYDADDAFLIPQGNNIFAVVGKIKNFEYIGLTVPATLEAQLADETEEIDFNMF